MAAQVSTQMLVRGPILGKMNIANPREMQLGISTLSRVLQNELFK